MNIGIVTVFDSSNFGSFLQAYALKSVMEEWGHNVYFIRTRSQKYVKNLYYSPKLFIHRLIKPPIVGLKEFFFGIKKYKYFMDECEKFNIINSYEDVALDIVILGSDEIWNVKQTSFKKHLFYGENMKNVISYAVSMGKATDSDMSEYPEIVELIKSIKHVLVRDINTRKSLEKLIGLSYPIVCDPTLLAEREIYNNGYSNKYLDTNEYILIYAYSLSSSMKKTIIKFARENNLKIVSACFYFGWCDYNFLCSPLDFCYVLRNAKYVMTETFHGTIFSAINHKQFVVIETSPKVTDIIERLNLNARFITNDCTFDSFTDKLINKKIDYNKVEEKISKMKIDSLKLFENNIKDIIDNEKS